MSIVVDASVIITLVIADERQAAVRAHLDNWIELGEELHPPAVLPYEVANVLARLIFDGGLDLDGVADTWSDLAALNINLHLFKSPPMGPRLRTSPRRCGGVMPPTRPTFALHSISTRPVWTLDGPLARNAADVGLPVHLIA